MNKQGLITMLMMEKNISRSGTKRKKLCQRLWKRYRFGY